MVVEHEELLACVLRRKTHKRDRLRHEAGGSEHQINEEHEIGPLDVVGELVDTQPRAVVLRSLGVDDRAYVERRHGRQVPTHLLRDHVPVRISVAYDQYAAVHGTTAQPAAAT